MMNVTPARSCRDPDAGQETCGMKSKVSAGSIAGRAGEYLPADLGAGTSLP